VAETETIGQRIARLRSERGLSQKEIAGPGVGHAYISRIEDGQRTPSLAALRVLAGDSTIVTNKVGEWIRGGPRLRRLALAFVTASDWKVFTKRAQILLDARPNDRQIRDFLIGVRYPRSWIGSSEPHLLAQAEAFRRWKRSRDPRLRALGAEAIAQYERMAAEAAERERRERESF
jgi:transcriptional regulator with XRE-family HTH domain